MKRLLPLLALLAASYAHAGDRFLGTITSAGTSINAGSTASPFTIPLNAKLTVQCDAIAYINTDSTTAVTSTNGVKVQADQPWQTSTSSSPTMNDGGSPSAWLNVISAAGTVNCRVFERKGTE